jgi:flagellar hook-associated protein 1 FlgK
VSNLFTSYSSAANSMRTYEKAMEVVQNDTVNSNTPGYVRQSVSFSSLPFDVNNSQAGGVTVGAVISSRDEYAENSVQVQQSAYSMSSTLASQLAQLQPLFDLQSTTGVAGSLNTLYAAFSQLTVSPNNAQTRQAVITAASGLVTAFNVAENGLTTGAIALDSSAQNAIKDLNNIISDIQALNLQTRTQSQSTPDPSVDARLHVDLENLSQYAGITSVHENDGTLSVYLNGQKPLLIGTTQNVLSVVPASSGLTVQSSDGTDIARLVSGGRLGAILQMRNTLIPSYQSQLDQLARNVADVINGQLNSGKDQNGNAGASLFSYNAAAPAQSLSITAITPSQVAAATAGNLGGNDNALALSALQNGAVAGLGGFSFTEFFGNLSANLGRDVSNTKNDQTTQQQLLAQAKSLRSQSSGVSLDEEAARLMEYQKTYAATGKLITVIDSMAQTLLGLIPS